MCKERWRTRDLLLEYDVNIMSPKPRAAGLGVIYPWENINNNILLHQLYNIALENGYPGTEETFKAQFGFIADNRQIVFDAYSNFPQFGSKEYLYIDTQSKIIYCWDNKYVPIYAKSILN